MHGRRCVDRCGEVVIKRGAERRLVARADLQCVNQGREEIRVVLLKQIGQRTFLGAESVTR